MAKAGKKDVINLTDKDYEGKNFKTAPGGTYFFLVTNKTAIKKAKSSGCNNLNVVAAITKGEFKGINVFDNIAPHVGWKVAQLLAALKVKKLTLTLQELKDLVVGKELRAVIREETYEGRKSNKIVQWLPLKGKKDEDEDDDEDDEEETDDEEQDEESSDEDDGDDEDESDDDGSDDDESDDDDDDDEEEEEEEEEEESSSRKGKKRAAKAGASAKSTKGKKKK